MNFEVTSFTNCIATVDLVNANKLAWEKKLEYDVNSDYYDLQSFRNGASTLYEIERAELLDFKDKRLLHFQCYFGLDTMSFLRLGASNVVGLDFSSPAINFARNLASELNLNAEFYVNNILDDEIKEIGKFDIVFCSYGSFCWLPDLQAVAKKAFHYLKPGGVFYVVDFHPLVYATGLMKSPELKYPYDNSIPFCADWTGTYADSTAPIQTKEYYWNHSISEIINTFKKNSFSIEFLNEHLCVPQNWFFNLIKNPKGYYSSKFNNIHHQTPLLFSMLAKK